MFEVWYNLDGKVALVYTTEAFAEAIALCDRLNDLAPAGHYTLESNWEPDYDPADDPDCEYAFTPCPF